MSASLIGPLTGPECRRLVGRRWLFLVRTLAALPGVAIVLIAAWIWWLWQQFDPNARPGHLYTGALIAVEGVAVTIAFVLSPALLAGTLAGEKSRGTLQLLLTTQVSSGQILMARLLSRLAQVGVILLAGLPPLVWIASHCRLPVEAQLALVVLPASVALGGGGMAIAASAVSRRARDALLAVYLIELMLLIGPPLAVALAPVSVRAWLLSLNPYQGVGHLAMDGVTGPAWLSIGWWTALGLASAFWGAWRLRPSYLRQIGGTPAPRPRSRRRVPPIGDNPMLWRELYLDRTESLGWVSRALGWLLVVVVLGGSLLFAGIIEYQRWTNRGYSSDFTAVTDMFGGVVAFTSMPVSWLLQWGIGLRAAVAVASEREHATWDALLVSPLEGREIVLAKIAGSLRALRGVILAVAAAWTIALAYGAMSVESYLTQVSGVVVLGFFMAAVGVWFSLVSTSTTWAMTFTLATWLAAGALMAFLAMILVAMGFLFLMVLWAAAALSGLADWSAGPPTPFSFEASWHVARCTLYLIVGAGVALHGRYRFDQLAGRAQPDPARQAFIDAHRRAQATRPATPAPARAEE